MAGEATHFRALYAQHAPAVRRFLTYLSGDSSLAEELAAETFARAWTALDRIREPTVQAYLFTIARNLYRNATRRDRRAAPLDVNLPDLAASPHRAAEARSELQSVRSAISRLSEAERSALLLRADHVSYEEIARILGISPTAAKVRVHRARAKLMSPAARNGEGSSQ